ncbi:MAG: IreB family regulatory phosphoprotein [Bacilli bacterium]|nr:IreB family regulatory phosphoprotein [Bacilli bacterium]
MSEETSMFSVQELKDELIKQTLKDVCGALKERGYDPMNQISGYLISGDPGYISSYKDARSKITDLDRSEIVKLILESFMNQK